MQKFKFKLSESWAHGNTGIRGKEDNSEFYSNLARQLTDEAQKLSDQAQELIEASVSGALIPSGTISFEELPENPAIGFMYNISNHFTTDTRFAEG